MEKGRNARDQLFLETKEVKRIRELYRTENARKEAERLRKEKEEGLSEEERFVPMEQKEEIHAFLEHIWREYDADNSGSIDAEETKKMIEKLLDVKYQLKNARTF